jgi:acyl-CoA reductase-like NAD-dependent aldehyde dehydrogenase
MSDRLQIPKMYKLFIGGKFKRTESERFIEVKNPRTKEKICNVSRASREDLRNAVAEARNTYGVWNSKTHYERGQILYRFAEMLEGRKEQFTEEIFISTKQTKQQCRKEVTKAIDRMVFYAGFCDKWTQLTGTVNPVQKGYFNFSIPEPEGVVGIILPDTLSFLPIVSRIAVVTCTGNSCVILTNDNSSLPSLTLSEVIATSDFPPGTINILTGYKNELIDHLAGHYDVNAIDFCENTNKNRKQIQELCSNNVKRFKELKDNLNWDWYDDKTNETLSEIEKFTEIKTVWHTMGM